MEVMIRPPIPRLFYASMSVVTIIQFETANLYSYINDSTSGFE